MGRIPDEILQQIRDRVDIVDLIGRFVALKRSGRNYKGLCPFHDEKTPSFSVSPDRHSFYCFGCQEKGDVFAFLMHAENLTFPEAVRALAQQCGIEIPESDRGERGLADRLLRAVQVAQTRYRAALDEPGNPGAAYLAGRGLDAAAIERFGIGWAPDRWDFLTHALRAEGISAQTGEQAGLLAPRRSGDGHYDLLRGRVTFPIRDVRGRVIGFGGRAVGSGQKPKYLNSPETPIFRKRDAFYGFPEALEPIRRSGRAVVVEGYFDRIALARAGVEGVVATCGTALTEDHARNLRRRTREVVLLFDGDEAGQKAIERSLEVLLPHDLRVRAAVLPAGEDPDSHLARHGAEALRALVEAAPPALDIAIERAVARGRATPWEKSDAVASVAPLLARIREPVERASTVDRLALAVGVDAAHVAAAVGAARRGDDPQDAVPIPVRRDAGEERKLRQLARSLFEYPHLAGRIGRDEVATLVPVRPLAELITTLVDAAASDEPTDLPAIADRLGDEAQSLLHSFAADGYVPDEPAAERTVDDTLRWLRDRFVKARQREITEQLKRPDADVAALLREKAALRKRTGDVRRDRPPAGPVA